MTLIQRVRGIGRQGLMVGALTIVAAVAVGWVLHVTDVHSAQIRALSTALERQRDQAQRAGQTPVAPPPADIMRNPAVVVGQQGVPGVPGVPGAPGRDGQNATDAQVTAAVEQYFARNPPKSGHTPTPAEIAVAVVNYLTAHPPAAGKDATPEQISAAVRTYLTATPPPPGPTGPAGTKGDQGPAPTAAQLADAVQAYLKQHPLPVCPSGSHIEEYRPPLDGRTFLVCTKD